MNKKQKKMLIRILAAAALMVGLSFLPVEGWLRFLLYLIPYFIIGYDILRPNHARGTLAERAAENRDRRSMVESSFGNIKKYSR